MLCPRCGVALVAGKVATASLDGCPTCLGLLLVRERLPALLQEIGPPATAERLTELPRRVKDVGGGLACPMCGARMTNDGFMASPFVMVDRCGSCDLMWIDDGELEAMAHQYARVRARSDEADQHRKEMSELSVLHWRFNPWRDGGV